MKKLNPKYKPKLIEIGKNIELIKLRLGLTRKEISDLFGITPDQYDNIVKGSSQITVDKLYTLAEYLTERGYNCDFNLILGNTQLLMESVMPESAEDIISRINSYSVSDQKAELNKLLAVVNELVNRLIE